ncbi:MAG: thiamine pyrophosphokinase [Paracoccaceae bacterium]|jgi:thiamine pyrophosphokinase
MKEKIVQTKLGITIIGAGRSSAKQIKKSRTLAPFVLAADGGVHCALKYGVIPDAVIGDLDGLMNMDIAVAAQGIHRIPEQDSTDFEKCLYSIDAPFVIAHGVTGSRFDHSLAAMNALIKYFPLPVIVVSGKDLIFVCPPELHLPLPVGTRVSLFPLATVFGKSKGLEYPIDEIELSPIGRIGTSNRTVDEKIEVSFAEPIMLVILPRKHLTAVVRALL